jgi:hypothetical protein
MYNSAWDTLRQQLGNVSFSGCKIEPISNRRRIVVDSSSANLRISMRGPDRLIQDGTVPARSTPAVINEKNDMKKN